MNVRKTAKLIEDSCHYITTGSRTISLKTKRERFAQALKDGMFSKKVGKHIYYNILNLDNIR